MATLSLGIVDNDAMPADRSTFLERYHRDLPLPQAKTQFRGEGNNEWCDFKKSDSKEVRNLQQFLHDRGFMPKDDMVDGIFGYATQAAVRLFQEYVRTVEKNASIGVPDGCVGPNTQSHIDRWKTHNITCEWAQYNAQNPMPEYTKWLKLIEQSKMYFMTNDSPMIDLVNKQANRGDTRPVNHWDHSPNSVHLIGLRQGEAEAATVKDNKGRFIRANDDLFILLINGMVFKFWGSTDPNPALSDNPAGNPFLIEGQHCYRFGWHKINAEGGKSAYRALEPEKHGVLVYRVPNAAGLTPQEVAGGIEKDPNGTINIHWSGVGSYNFSAGCQVISGKSYINHRDEVVNLGDYAAVQYEDLSRGKVRGAYNVFTDLLLSYGPPGVRTISYTLGRDETLTHFGWDAAYVTETVKRLMGK